MLINPGTLGSTTGADANDPLWIAGKIGGALQFDGANDHVNAGNGASLDIINAITIAAWVNVNGLPADRGRIVWKYSPAGYGLELASTGRFFSTNYYQTTGWGGITGTTTAVLHQWHHVVFVFTGSQNQLYVNGVSDVTPQNLADTIRSSTASIRIGGNPVDNVQYFNGTIDEVRIYNRALSAAEIKALHEAGLQ